MTKSEARARKLFRKVRIGHHYEWRSPNGGELCVLRVLKKRLTVGAECKAEAAGVFFFLNKEGEPTGEGSPAYSHNWTEVTPKFVRWKGTRPRRAPVHARVACSDCGDLDPASYEDDDEESTHCCGASLTEHRFYQGPHDDTCLCTDCKDERRA